MTMLPSCGSLARLSRPYDSKSPARKYFEWLFPYLTDQNNPIQLHCASGSSIFYSKYVSLDWRLCVTSGANESIWINIWLWKPAANVVRCGGSLQYCHMITLDLDKCLSDKCLCKPCMFGSAERQRSFGSSYLEYRMHYQQKSSQWPDQMWLVCYNVLGRGPTLPWIYGIVVGPMISVL